MLFTGNTVLITGGSSGIGLELTGRLIEKGNQVIICGRSEDKLIEAKRLCPKVHYYVCDISDESQLLQLSETLSKECPQLNVLINNAAIVHNTSFERDADIIDKAKAEINTNLLAPIILTKKLFPLLKNNKNAKLVNITTGLVYAPRADYPFYNATKAALHSFTQTLRMQLRKSPVKIIEVLFPVVDTPWHNGTAPKIAITAEQAVMEMIQGLEGDKEEIRVGKVKLLCWVARIAPGLALKIINGIRRKD